jgi:peptidylprolyl isomerase
MAQAKPGDKVKVNYTGRFEDGTVFDSSAGRKPLEFTVESGQVIRGFDEAVKGLSPGESRTVTIPAEEAYGPYQQEAVMTVDRGEFPEDMDPQVGDRMQLMEPDGRMVIAVVTGSDEKSVTLDANHPLAGKTLVFDVELVDIS